MAAEITGRRRPTKPKKQARSQKRTRDDVDVEKLEAAVAELDTKERFEKFIDLPLSEPTKAGLKACHFSILTDIQSRAIVLGLKGSDILGAAKTGSGKTLAFLIPVLENLYRQQCIGSDAGLAAMIISPTRELAIQIFDVLRGIGKHGHMFAAGLVIGGKSLKEEQGALSRMNIVVCTPGRMLQHLSQTAAFNVDQLRMLVLDEADRIMDMGFQRDVDAIIDYLPTDRQTLLFSATQTKRVSDLARLSLRDPEYVSVHEAASSATPKTLQQNYVLTPLPTKMDTLWSFIQSAKKSKLLVFFSSAKQVRFVYESFRKLQPGMPLLHLHGRQRQTARLDITSRFSSARYSCLFATDVVARGLDFPAVDWVIQVDCPEDADTYIHRVGRTARYESEGRAVLFLDPTEEEGMLSRLAAKKVPIERINIRQKKQTSIQNQLQNMCFKDPELKYLGQKAFSSYVRSVHLQKDKEVFRVQDLELEAFAASIGLPGAPRIKFLSSAKAEELKALKNAPRRLTQLDDSASDSSDAADEHANGESRLKAKSKAKPAVRTKYDRMFERRNQDILSSHYTRMIEAADPGAEDEANGSTKRMVHDDAATSDDDNEDELFAVKRRIAPPSISPAPDDEDSKHGDISALTDRKKPVTIDSQRRQKALRSKKQMAKIFGASASKLVFDEDGTAHPAQPFIDAAELSDTAGERARFVEREGAEMRERDAGDREVWRDKRRAKKAKRKERERLEGMGIGMVPQRDDDGLDGDDGDMEGAQRPFEELADLYSDSEDGSRHHSKKPSRPPKWFEQPGKTAQAVAEPQTLEDLEALATGLLN